VQTLERESLRMPHVYGVDGARPAVMMPKCPGLDRAPELGECTYCPDRGCPGNNGAWGNWHRHMRYQGIPHPSWFRVGENRPEEGER
jgi:hypothetical protein